MPDILPPYVWRVAPGSRRIEVRTPTGVWHAPTSDVATRGPLLMVWSEWRDLFAANAKRTGVPLEWLVAIARWESGGDPDAVGTSGEVGLFQLMPALWRGHSAAEMKDPARNTEYAADLLRDLRKSLGDRLPEVCSVYNCGAAKWTPTIEPKRPTAGELYPWGLCEVTKDGKNLGYITKIVAASNLAPTLLEGWPKAGGSPSSPATSTSSRRGGAAVAALAVVAGLAWWATH